MNAPAFPELSRRALLAAGGALVVSFSLRGIGSALAQSAAPERAPDGKTLDSWIQIEANGTVTIFTGRTEFGQGVKTALLQVAAEELYLDPATLKIVSCDTALTPDEGYTSGSRSMKISGKAMRAAAAQAREILLKQAAAKFSTSAEGLKLERGKIVAPDGRSLGYGELVADNFLHVEADEKPKLKEPKSYTVVGHPFARVDIPAKVTGGAAYIQDLRLPGMVHARVVRPPTYAAVLRSVDAAKVEKMPGVLKVVRDGSYLAVIAEKEFQAITAMQALAAAAKWDEQAVLPANYAALYEFLQNTQSQEVVIHDNKVPLPPDVRTVVATFKRDYQMHGSIGPSCAVALFDNGKLTVWAQNQGAYPLREAVAELVNLPAEKVRCIHVEGAGCYGHNGADDAGGDAALLAMALPGRPVRVQWMRQDEHGWEPYGSAMLSKARASVDARGQIVDWEYDVWSMTHSTRPGGAKCLSASWYREQPLKLPPARAPKPTETDGNRNATPPYKVPSIRIVHHHIKEMALRVSALRSLGAYMNVFANESLMDELARAASADPVDFRIRHLDDSRAIDVIRATAERFGWSQSRLPQGRGRGFAYARYRNGETYVAVAVEADVDRASGAVRLRRIAATADSGQAVSPDGIRNQIEGGIHQAASWTLYEAVSFDKMRITSRDWAGYPIMRFDAVPDAVDVQIIDRPGKPFLGTGEAAQGPTAAAIANAVADAIGTRIYELPLKPERIKAAIRV